MTYLAIKNWSEFQHYKDRNPPWIKLHRTLLDDYEFGCLQDASKLHLILIWLFASQCEGRVPDDPVFLQKKLGLTTKPDLKTLVDHGFLIPEQSASTTLAPDASKLRLEAYKASEAYKSTETEALKILTDLGVDQQHAKDWLKVRKVKRAPFTESVLQLLHAQASKAGITVAAAVKICAEKSWQGFNADWDWGQTGTKKPNGGNGQWMFSNQGIEAKAAEIGIASKAGESYQDLKARVIERLGV